MLEHVKIVIEMPPEAWNALMAMLESAIDMLKWVLSGGAVATALGYGAHRFAKAKDNGLSKSDSGS